MGLLCFVPEIDRGKIAKGYHDVNNKIPFGYLVRGAPFDAVWGRVREITGWTKQSELAAFLEIKSPGVAKAKARQSFPNEWALKIAQGYGVSLDWLLSGEGARFRGILVAGGNAGDVLGPFAPLDGASLVSTNERPKAMFAPQTEEEGLLALAIEVVDKAGRGVNSEKRAKAVMAVLVALRELR